MRKRTKNKFIRWLKYLYYRLVRINDTPEKIAQGFALGVFIGVFPSFGIGLIAIIFLATIFKFNKIAGILGTLIAGNPIVSPALTGFSYYIGKKILWYGYTDIRTNLDIGFNDVMKFLKTLNLHEINNTLVIPLKKGVVGFFVPYTIGMVILCITVTIASYFIALKLILLYKQYKIRRKRRKAGAEKTGLV